jgi:hypothetical protein
MKVQPFLFDCDLNLLVEAISKIVCIKLCRFAGEREISRKAAKKNQSRKNILLFLR